MIRVITGKDEFGVPTSWRDVPSVDLERVPPRMADRIDVELAGTEGFGISCYGDAVWRLAQVRAGYLERQADPAEADRWLALSKDVRDLGVVTTWVALHMAGSDWSLQQVYDGADGLDFVEVADPTPVPKQPQDHKGKAKAGSRRRVEPA